jgi:hypothetical protein
MAAKYASPPNRWTRFKSRFNNLYYLAYIKLHFIYPNTDALQKNSFPALRLERQTSGRTIILTFLG